MNKLKILIIEDNPGDADLLVEYLSETTLKDSKIELSNTLKQACEKIEKINFDVVLMDIGLPDSIGLSGLKKIIGKNKSFAIIMISGLNDIIVAEQAVKLGADDFLVKGKINGELLNRSIRYSIERKNNKIKILKDKNLLEEKNKELSHFTYIASHDLQEPLNTIISFSGLLKESYYDKLEGLGEKCIEVIDSSVFRMKELVVSLLVYSRIGKNNKLELVNVNKILDEIKTDLGSSIAENNVTFISGDLLEIIAFRLDFRMLLSNLITNAIKYRKVTQNPVIKIEVTQNLLEYTYSVTDNGIGIDMQYKDKIFEVFHRLHTNDKYSGTGIGLANCYRIAELHNGKIWVNSEKNTGSKFSFTINKGLQDG